MKLQWEQRNGRATKHVGNIQVTTAYDRMSYKPAEVAGGWPDVVK
jgi:hypothetical protein